MSDTLLQVDVPNHDSSGPGSCQQPAAESPASTIHSPPTTGLRPAAGHLLRILVGCLIGGLLIDTWLVQGLFTRAVVTSGSMAPAFVGPHCDVVCPNCGIDFCCEASDFAPANLVCPNCCHRQDDFGISGQLPGDRLLVDRTAFVGRPPERWEAVVFRAPAEVGGLCIKRVVGLPGETVEILDGEVFIDGRIARKDIQQFRETAILVHEERGSSGQRWKGEQAGSQWRSRGGEFVHAGGETTPAEIDWLTHEHRQPSSNPAEIGPILDDLPYSPAESRILNPVRDLLLRCRILSTGNAPVWLRAQAGRDQQILKLDLNSGFAELIRNGVATIDGSFSPGAREHTALVEFGIVDRCVWLTVDREVLLTLNLDATQSDASQGYDAPGEPDPRPFSIGARDGSILVSDLEIVRDIYYAPGQIATVQLGPRDLFVLGDNSPHSEDSRHWGPAAVTLSDLVGKPHRASFDQRRGLTGGR